MKRKKEPGLPARAVASNEKTLAALTMQLRSSVGVIPFLGAGVSAPFDYPQWGAFLRDVARNELNARDRARTLKLIDKEDYERAAAVIAASLGTDDYQRAIAERFSDDRLQGIDLSQGALALVPLLTSGPVITTNFDRVIEHVFDRAGHPFAERVYGANPDEVVPAIQQNRLVLWKVHGDRADRRTRVLSELDYNRHYVDLPRLLELAFANRPSLFIGCSLRRDRTVEVLQEMRRKYPGLTHYAITECPPVEEKYDQRNQALRALRVRPIWYREGKHEEVQSLLEDLVQRVSSYRLDRGKATRVKKAAARKVPTAALKAELRKIREPLVAGEAPPYVPILYKLTRGQISFFLGSGACMGRLPLAGPFYEHLRKRFTESEGSGADPYGNMERARITQHFADKYGREALYGEVDRFLETTGPRPTAIHWFIATLQKRLRAKGYRPAPLLIFTTNYDDWMERALEQSGEPYHLFVYRASDPHFGSYLHRDPSGQVSLVDRPRHFRRLADEATVLVKLHGGLAAGVDLPISYAFMHRDFVELAGRIPRAIPEVILDRLAAMSLLFLGSGLGDDSIESLVRERQQAGASWAIQLGARKEMRLYWQQLGVELINTPLEIFVRELNRRFEELAPIRGR